MKGEKGISEVIGYSALPLGTGDWSVVHSALFHCVQR
jgi:hypothetical protein